MDRDEIADLLVCRGCGAEISSLDRSFVFGEDEALCYACAVDRGGVYDERLDAWEQAPSVTDLASSEA